MIWELIELKDRRIASNPKLFRTLGSPASIKIPTNQ